jgi:xylulose-5-phosphate/fructose-6-phosphate phosphoketolase
MYRFEETVSSAVPDDGTARKAPEADGGGPLSADELDALDLYWRAANYLTIGQIYLQDNPLLKQPLKPSHVKPRLLGHWGTSPGLNLVYAHLNRLIRERGVDAIFLAGPGHGGPAVLANVYLEGTYSEIYPEVSRDAAGMRRLFRQFSTPGGVPSHVSVPTPGSIHEGGELGYVLAHAFGAAFDNPDLLVLAVVGDGEAETAPLEGSWKSTAFIDPARDGAVLPVLHLNGYKISGPTVLGRTPDDGVRSLLEGHGYEVRFVEGDDPSRVHQAFASALEACHEGIRAIQTDARENGFSGRPRWPAIVLRTPKGWTGPEEVDGLPVAGTFRSHQVPLAGVRDDPERLGRLREWMLSYRPDELFDEGGRPVPGLGALVPEAAKRMGASPYANGGRLLEDLDLPDFRDYRVGVPSPATVRRESTRLLGEMLRDTFLRNAEAKNFRLFCPDETNSNRLGAVFEATDRCFVGETLPADDHVAPSGRVMEVLSEHLCEGWLEGYLLTGRHGLFATYEAFAMVSSSMTVQHTKWLEEAVRLPWREPISSLNVLLTSTAWRNDHNGFSHQGPGLIDVMLSKRGTVARIYLPPDANCLLSVADHCLRSRDYVNLIVIDKQPQLQWLGIDAAIEHCTRGASVWEWASNVAEGEEPDVVLACAGDIPTLETVAAAHWLKENAPGLKVRVVNVVDLMALFPREFHPHGMEESRFVELFTADRPVVFAFHGYQRAIHEIVHGHVDVDRIHVRGFNEQGTTTTPFEMTVLNGMSRYHLAAEAIRRSAEYPNSRPQARAPTLISKCEALVSKASAYAREHLEDPPEIREWRWSP